MSEPRYRLDLAAGALLVAGLLVALCVLGHDPGPGAAYPSPESSNPLGAPGALLAEALYEALGVAVYLLLASWFVLVVLLFLRRSWLTWSLRLVGWLTLLPCAAAAAELLAPYWSGGHAERGGTLGAWLVLRGRERLSPPFLALALAGALLLGLLLALDFAPWRVARGVWRLTRRLLARGRPQPVEAMTDAAPEADPAPVVKMTEVGGRAIPIHHHDRLLADAVAADAHQRRATPTDADRFAGFELPTLALLEEPEPFPHAMHDQHLRDTAALLEKTFADFNLSVHVVGINTGPVVTQYEVSLETGLRVNKVTGLGDDLALNLKVPSVRIVAPIPGKNTVGIEVPNNERQLVRLREVIEESAGKAKKMRIPIYLGKDVAGNPLIVDLTTLPHLLIAGRTGTGKSVCLNSIILSMLMSRGPDDVRMLMIDPKMVELSPYKRLPHLMHPVVTDMRKAEAILAWAVEKMEERYALLARAGVRHISVYNQLGEEELMERLHPENDEQRAEIPLHLPYIVIVADEIADLMMTSGKEVEQHIIRLAQKSRAVGIHLVLATQKPTVDVITGLIKSNLPARIAFQVASRTDSRVVLDEMGADKLLGNGDMLFLWPGTSTLLRGQGTYLTDEEINRVVDFVGTTEPQFVKELVQLKAAADPSQTQAAQLRSRDELYEAAVDIVIREGRGSVSLLQRALGIGYGRSARLVDFMAEDGIVGEYNGSQAREVLITLEQWAEMIGQEPEPTPPPSSTKRNRILPNASPPSGKLKHAKKSTAPFEVDQEDNANEDREDQDEIPVRDRATARLRANKSFDEEDDQVQEDEHEVDKQLGNSDHDETTHATGDYDEGEAEADDEDYDAGQEDDADDESDDESEDELSDTDDADRNDDDADNDDAGEDDVPDDPGPARRSAPRVLRSGAGRSGVSAS